MDAIAAESWRVFAENRDSRVCVRCKHAFLIGLTISTAYQTLVSNMAAVNMADGFHVRKFRIGTGLLSLEIYHGENLRASV